MLPAFPSPPPIPSPGPLSIELAFFAIHNPDGTYTVLGSRDMTELRLEAVYEDIWSQLDSIPFPALQHITLDGRIHTYTMANAPTLIDATKALFAHWGK